MLNVSKNQKIIENMVTLLSDYGSDVIGASTNDYSINSNSISKWLAQFDDNLHKIILSETYNILKQRYLSRDKAKAFLKDWIFSFASKKGFNSLSEFLKNTYFYDIQKPHKSQRAMLNLLDDICIKECGIKISRYENLSENNLRPIMVYLDDMLCTGNTIFESFFIDINSVSNMFSFGSPVTIDDKVYLIHKHWHSLYENKSKIVICTYFSHKRNLGNL